MTTLPPILAALDDVFFAVDDVVDDVLDELPPQAADARHTAANDTIHMQRLEDILISSRRTPAAGWTYAPTSFGKDLNKTTLSPLLLRFN
jgi:hypothetical protein